ncbi:MAG: MBL fold metallo-hydrolase, partial [Actinomycetes bacterium]
GDPGEGAVVVDPGPLNESHLRAVLHRAGGQVSVVLLTHRHPDHAAGAARFAVLAQCPVRSVDPSCRVGPDGLADGDQIETPGVTLRTLLTPGHTSDSCCFLLDIAGAPPRLLTGDTVLGRGTTVIARPDGDLAAYLASLDRLQRLVADAGVGHLLPGHGPVVSEPSAWLAYYRAHRLERLEQVRAAYVRGAQTAADIVAVVYADVDRAVWPAAEQSVAAQLDYLSALEDDS